MSSRIADTLFALPLPLSLPVPIFLTFLAIYFLASPHFATEKQRAYILSSVSACTMVLVSLPYVWNYLVYGLETCFEQGQHGWVGTVGQFGTVFFGMYLFTDLALGWFVYPSQIGLLTGWVHHICYIIIMIHCINSRLSPIFLVAGIMETPTLDLALSNLFPVIRNDVRFLTTFFVIRIFFHAIFLLDCARPSSRAVTDGSFLPASMLFLAIVLHITWFRGGYNGYVKRRRAAGKSTILGDVQQSTSGDIILRVAAELDPSVAPPTLVTPPGTRTPEDSPLVTPHTTGVTPLTLRDSYLFPTISMPVMPNLPTVQIPTLSAMSMPTIPSFSDMAKSLHTDNLNFGFRDAVKFRWEEQRGRLGRGRGMSLSLGGLGLGRGGQAAGGDTVKETQVYGS